MATAPPPPPVSIREQLLAAITTAVDGTYGTPTPEDERELPATIVQDGSDEAATRYDSIELTTPVAVARVAIAASDDLADMRAQANEMLAQIVTDMHADETFGGLAYGVDYAGGGIQVEQGKFVFAEASFGVRWSHLRGNPYLREEPTPAPEPPPAPEPSPAPEPTPEP